MRILKYNGIEFSSKSKYVVSEFDVGAMDTTYTDIEYVNRDGSKRTNVFYTNNQITLNGFINANNKAEFEVLRRKLIHAINPKKEIPLYLNSGRIKAFVPSFASLKWAKQYGNHLQYFTITFDVPSFYWLSQTVFEKDLLYVNKKISSPFTFHDDGDGKIFSTRDITSNIINNGDESADIKITLSVKKNDTNQSDSNNMIVLRNETDKKQLALNYRLSHGEIITFDMENTSVVSSKNGNIIKYIVDVYNGLRSEFFNIDVGKSLIKCDIANKNFNGCAILSFREKYRGI